MFDLMELEDSKLATICFATRIQFINTAACYNIRVVFCNFMSIFSAL